MGVYLFSSASTEEVKVSGVLREVLPTLGASSRMDASEFLVRLARVEQQFRSGPTWKSFVASGAKAECDALYRDGSSFAAVPGSAAWPWFEDQALLRARTLAERSLEAGSPVCWS